MEPCGTGVHAKFFEGRDEIGLMTTCSHTWLGVSWLIINRSVKKWEALQMMDVCFKPCSAGGNGYARFGRSREQQRGTKSSGEKGDFEGGVVRSTAVCRAGKWGDDCNAIKYRELNLSRVRGQRFPFLYLHSASKRYGELISLGYTKAQWKLNSNLPVWQKRNVRARNYTDLLKFPSVYFGEVYNKMLTFWNIQFHWAEKLNVCLFRSQLA